MAFIKAIGLSASLIFIYKTKYAMRSVSIILIFLLLMGCSKSDDDVIPEIKIKLLKKVTYVRNQSSTYEVFYEYDAMNRLSSRKNYDDNGELLYNYEYIYYEDTIRINQYWYSEFVSYTIEYSVTEGHVKELYGKKWNNQDSMTYLGHEFMVYDDCSNIESKAMYSEYDENYENWKFEYFDENYSFNLNKFDSNGRMFSRGRIIKNDKVSAYNSISEFKCFLRSEIASTNWNGDDIILHQSSSEFEYDDQNYPVHHILTFLNGDSAEIDYEYY